MPFMTFADDGQVADITLTESNTLRETLVEQEYTNVTSLTLHGPIGSDDLNTIYEGTMLTNVEYVDLRDVTIVPDGGKYAYTSIKPGAGDWITRQNHYLSDREEIVYETGSTGLGSPYALWNCYTTDLSGVFCDKSSLRTVYMPKNVKAVGLGVFAYSSVEKVVFPDGITQVRMSAFQDCANLNDFNLGQLTEIDKWAFAGTPITNIDLSKCTRIEAGAFYDTNLKEADLRNVSSLPSAFFGVFRDCKSLTNVSFSNKLTSIGGNAFYGCEALTVVEGIPADIDSLDATSFEGTPWFNNLPYKDDIKYIGHVAMCASSTATALKFKEGTSFIADNFSCSNASNVTSLTLPSTLRYIGDEALQGLGISSLTIPESVEYFGYMALSGNSATKITYNAISAKTDGYYGIAGDACLKVVIGSKVEVIPRSLFYNAHNLTVVDCEERSSASPGIKIEKYAFRGCENLKKFNGFQYVDSIGESAFQSSGITTVTLGTNLREIGEYAFYSSGLKTVKCEKRTDSDPSLTIGEDAFAYCYDLVDFGAWEYVDSINSYAFSHCEALKSIGTSNRLKYVSEYAFNYCNIDSIYFNGLGDESGLPIIKNTGDITSATIGKDATSVPNHAFSYRDSLKAVHFEEREEGSLVEIGEYAFYHCNSLKHFDFSKVSSIGEVAFLGCAFDSIYLSNNISSIGTGAFAGNSTLKYVYYDIPNVDGYNLFWHYKENTPALQTVIIGPNVRELGQIFYGCDSLSCFTFDGWETPWGTNYDTRAKSIATNGQTLKINSYALSGLKGLDGTDLVLPHGTQHIGMNAFDNVNFKRVFVPSTIETIDNNGEWQQKVSYNYGEDTEVILLADTMYVLPSLVEAFRAKYTASYTFLPISEEYLPSDIKSVTVEAEGTVRDVVFYDLSGLRLSTKPAKAGIYICEQDGKRKKVLIKN